MIRQQTSEALKEYKAWAEGSFYSGTGADLNHANLNYANFGLLHILQIGPIGSRKATLVYKWGHTSMAAMPIDEAMTGCYRGTLEDLETAVGEVHSGNEHGKAYRAAIAFIRQMMEVK